MAEYIITLDTGTTNTRASLWLKDGTFLGEERCEAGVRNTAVDGNNRYLKTEVGTCLKKLVGNQGLTFEQIDGVFASGMITSNVGLLEVPHLTAPAGAEDFAAQVRMAKLPEVCPVPIYFIRGLKNQLNDFHKLDKMDIMRGEEVETLALLEECPAGSSCLFILPGSHTKFVFTDENKKITGCLTSLTGELLETITRHTILADAVERSFVSKNTYRKDAVLCGYRAAKTQGFGRAAFLTRIYRMFAEGEQKEQIWAANYLLGTVLWNDAAALRGAYPKEKADKAVGMIAGKEPFASGLYDVLSEDGYIKEIRRCDAKDGPSLSARGTFAIAKIFLERQQPGESGEDR